MQKKILSWVLTIVAALTLIIGVPINANAVPSTAVFSDGDLDQVYFVGDSLSFNLSGIPVGIPPAGIPEGTTIRVSIGYVPQEGSSFTSTNIYMEDTVGLLDGSTDGTGYYFERTLLADGTLSSPISGTLANNPNSGIAAVKLYVFNGEYNVWQDALQGQPTDYIPLTQNGQTAFIGIDNAIVLPAGISSNPVLGERAQNSENLRNIDISFSKNIATDITGKIAFTGINLIDNSSQLSLLDTGLIMLPVDEPAEGTTEQYTLGVDVSTGVLDFLANTAAIVSVTSPSFDGLSTSDFSAAASDATGGTASNLVFDDESDTVSFTVDHFSTYTLSMTDPNPVITLPETVYDNASSGIEGANIYNAIALPSGNIGALFNIDGSVCYGELNLTQNQWTTVNLGTTASTDINAAALAIDSLGNPHVVFVNNNNDLLYRYYTGSGWTTGVTIDSIAYDDIDGALSSPDIAIDAAGYAHISYHDAKGGREASMDYSSYDVADLVYATNEGGSSSFTKTVRSYSHGWFWSPDGWRNWAMTPSKIVYANNKYYIGLKQYQYQKDMFTQYHTYSYDILLPPATPSNDLGYLIRSATTNNDLGFTLFGMDTDGSNVFSLFNKSGSLYVTNGISEISAATKTFSAAAANIFVDGTKLYYAAINGSTLLLYQDGTFKESLTLPSAISGSYLKTATVVSGDTQYVLYTDTNGNLQLVGVKTTADTAAPVNTTDYPQITTVTETGFDINASVDESANIYYIVVDKGSTAPTSAQVVAGTDYGVTVIKSGSISLLSNCVASKSITGLSAATEYDVYIVAKDYEGNLQSTPTLLQTATTKNKITIAAKSGNPTEILNNGNTYEFVFTISGNNISTSGEYNPDLKNKMTVSVSNLQNCTFNTSDQNAYTLQRVDDNTVEANVQISSSAADGSTASLTVNLAVNPTGSLINSHELGTPSSASVSEVNIANPPASSAPNLDDLIITRTSATAISITLNNVSSGTNMRIYTAETDGTFLGNGIAMGTSINVTNVAVNSDVATIYLTLQQDYNHAESSPRTEVSLSTYIPSLAPSTAYTYPELCSGYADDSQSVKTFTINNNGTAELTGVSVSLSGDDTDCFAVVQPATSIAVGSSTTFTVKANNDLAAGTYTATVVVSADNANDLHVDITQSVLLDTDSDGVPDASDNAPYIANPDQIDTDGDGIGDVADNAPNIANPGQEDADSDGVGDVADNAPTVANPGQEDADGDGVGDVADNAPNNYNPGQEDADCDGVGDVADNAPTVANPGQEDADSDGIGDVADNAPNNYNPDQKDTDTDGIGDVIDDDDDGDGILDTADNAPLVYNPGQEDHDGDGLGDVIDNEAPVVTSDWNDTTVYFGQQYPFNVTVSDYENTTGTTLYSYIDSAVPTISWVFPGAPDTISITLCPMEGVLSAGDHTLNYYAVDNKSAISQTLTLHFTLTNAPTGGSSDNDSTPAAPQITTTTSGNSTINSTILTPTTSGDTASASVSTAIVNALIDKADSSGGTGENDTIELAVDTPAGIDKLQLTIPQISLANLAESNNADFMISSDFVSLSFDNRALETIANANQNSNVVFSVNLVDHNTLSTSDQLLVNNRPVYDFNVINGGEQVSSFGGGQATVQIPYTLQKGENPKCIVVFYLADDGTLKTVRGHYDASSKSVIFKTTHFSQYVIGYNQPIFTDVADNAWYKDAVNFIAARNITAGTSANQYSPEAKLTRGQFVVLLMNAYSISTEIELTDQITPFSDAGDTYYTAYLLAAKELGIVNGVGNNLFAPEREITRQEMFLMLYNALTAIGDLPTASTGNQLADFNDADQAAPWAQVALNSLIGSGIISGSNNMIYPTATTTRAEMAQVLYNLLSE